MILAMRKLVLARRLSQVIFLVLFTYILWSTTYPLKGIISPRVIFNLDPLIMSVTALSENVLLPGLIFSVLMVLLTLILGRFFCGWVCPMGTLIDWIGAWKPFPKLKLNKNLMGAIFRPKFAILVVILFFAATGRQAAWMLDPIVTVARVVSLNIIPAVTLAIDKVFQFLIQKMGLYEGVYDFYRSLKEGLLGVNVYFFANSMTTFFFFLLVCAASLLILRLWCRMLCPLGAWYAWNSRPALLERRVRDCTSCGVCARRCRMGAIDPQAPGSYLKGECILCMDCVYDCPQKGTGFSWKVSKPPVAASQGPAPGMSRGQFLLLMGSLFSCLGFKSDSGQGVSEKTYIRPPGALPEESFVNTCIRCGNCMKVCITNGLQPVMLDPKLSRLWTPQLVPEIGYCEYNCTLCGEVCPTGAMPRLSLPEKHRTKLGLAVIDRSICLAWAGNKQCIVCEEHCPVPEKAIKTVEEVVSGKRIWRPFVDEKTCIGCGICQNKCPVLPVRAIRVDPNKGRS